MTIEFINIDVIRRAQLSYHNVRLSIHQSFEHELKSYLVPSHFMVLNVKVTQYVINYVVLIIPKLYFKVPNT